MKNLIMLSILGVLLLVFVFLCGYDLGSKRAYLTGYSDCSKFVADTAEQIVNEMYPVSVTDKDGVE